MTRRVARARALALGAAFGAALGISGPAGSLLSAQDPAVRHDPAVRQDSAMAESRCPERFSPVRESASGALRCGRVEVQWVVTICADSAYATYRARPGADACLPTSLPGVGTTPGVRGSRPVVCAGHATGFPIVRDRVGDRDRCEREHQTFSPPLTAPGPAKTGG